MEMNLKFLDNKYVSTVLSVLLAVYGGMAAPTLPPYIQKLFGNEIFRIVVLALIVYKGQRDPQLALMIAVAFVVTMNYLNESTIKENFRQVEKFRRR